MDPTDTRHPLLNTVHAPEATEALKFPLVGVGRAICMGGFVSELLSKLVFSQLNQAATCLTSVTSTPSLNLIPVTTFAR